MKTATRRWIGVVLLGASVVSWLAVSWSGVWRGAIVHSETHSFGSVTATAEIYESHTPLWFWIGLLGVAGIGLLMLLLPNREKTNA